MQFPAPWSQRAPSGPSCVRWAARAGRRWAGGPGSPWLLALFVLCLVLAPRSARAQAAGADLAAAVGALDSPDFERREAAAASLREAGLAGARAVLLGFAGAPPRSRLLRAQVLRANADASLLPAVLEVCSDPSPEVRAEFAAVLGPALRQHPRPARELGARICVLLRDWAGEDVALGVRSAALEALSRADSEPAAAALAELARASRGGEGALVARALANSPRGGEALVEMVAASFESPRSRLSEPVLAVLLAEGYGPALAEQERGGLEPRERAALARGGKDLSPAVAAASQLALRGFLGRASFLGASARAEAVCAALAQEVSDPVPILLASAVLSLSSGSDPTRALEPLERIAALRSPPRREDSAGRFDLAVAHTLEAATHVACGRPESAAAFLEQARTLLAGLAAEGLERGGSQGAQLAAEVAAERAVVESYALLALLRAGQAFDSPECRQVARLLHELSLRAQLLSTAGALESWTGDLDSLIHHPHAPFELLLSNPELARHLGANPRDLALSLGRALAHEAPDELPGFAAATQPGELDELRGALLTQIEFARIDQIQRELARLPADSGERPELENALRVLGSELAREPDLHRVRLPSALAIELAGELRDEGRAAEAGELSRQAKAALERADFLFGGPYVQELIARAESIVGSCATDAGDPQAADRILNAALSRLETLSRSGIDDSRSKAVRSNVLVSLAVNANVKLRDPLKALAYFERAYELRQDDFTRTLLACYRARAGRGEEARALLREMPESPYNYYNLACTYALLGDVELALDYLERELRAGSKSPGAIERQRLWARSDPDLEKLRGEPRFKALVGE